MGIRNSIIAFILMLLIAIPALAAPVSFTLMCDANHPNDDVVKDQVWMWHNNQIAIISEEPHPPPIIIDGIIVEEGEYDWTTAHVEFPLTIERRTLARAVLMAVAVDSSGYTSAGNTSDQQVLDCNSGDWLVGFCSQIKAQFENYDKDDLHDELWACWEDQGCIDRYLKAKKLIIHIEGDGP